MTFLFCYASVELLDMGENSYDDEYERVVQLLEELDNTKSPEVISRVEHQLQEIGRIVKRYGEQVKKPGASYTPYPDISSDSFYHDLLKKKEFKDNKYESETIIDRTKTYDDIAKEKCSLQSFNLRPDQMMIKNFLSPLTPYNGLLLFHGVGIGKTCTAINIAEQYLDGENKRKVLVLMPSTLLKDNFKTQIYDTGKHPRLQCVGSKYAAMVPNRTMLSKEMMEKKVNKIIASRYKFMGVMEFANEIDKIRKDIGIEEYEDENNVRFHNRLRKEFSNMLIIIDEVHNLRSDSDATKKRVPPLLELVLKKAHNNKLVLMTATPMFNDPKEIVYIANLLLHNDKRPPIKISDVFDKRGNIKSTEAEDKLKTALRGYVSFMSANNPFSLPFRLYPSINGDANVMTDGEVPQYDIKGVEIDVEDAIDPTNMEIVLSTFEKPQRLVYRQSEKAFVGESEAVDENSFNLQLCTQLSNIVYPVSNAYKSCYGETAFWGVFERVRGKGFGVRYKDGHEGLLAPTSVASVSCKIASILKYVKEAQGIVFVYSNWKWSGVLPLAIALEHEGFNKYNGRNILQSVSGGKKRKGSGNYIILSGDKDISPDNDGEIQAAKSAANTNGDVVKVILATSVATEGIDFKCIREIHLLEPWFHMNKVEQIIGRAVRTCSHMALEPGQRNVTIYQHASTLRGQRESIDLRMYRMSYMKQRRIKTVEKLMRSVAIDCSLNAPALDWDVDTLNMTIDMETSQGKKIKAYPIGSKKENVTCVGNIPDVEDRSTFTTSFYYDVIPRYVTCISQMFKQTTYATYQEISRYVQLNIPKMNVEALNVALDFMLRTKEQITNADMTNGYLMYASDKYIFQPISSKNVRMSLSSRTKKSHRRDPSLLEIRVDEKGTRSSDNGETLEYFVNQMIGLRSILNITDAVENKKIENVMCDFVVDRLPKKIYLEMCKLVIRGSSEDPNVKMFEESVERSRMFVKRADGMTLFVVAPHDNKNTYYALGSDGDMREISELEHKENRQLINASVPNVMSHLKDYDAYLLVNEEGKSKFKLLQKDKDSMGYVCDQTSTLTVVKLKTLIDGLDETIVGRVMNQKKKLPDKKCLCQLYEIAIRAVNTFARPNVVNILLDQEKNEAKQSKDKKHRK